MDDTYFDTEEIGAIFELIIAILCIIVGMIFVQSHIRVMERKSDLNDNLDKVQASAEYDTIKEEVFKFTPYQAYMMGYYMDNWGPDLGNEIIYHDEFNPAQTLNLSPEWYQYNLVQRNNLISGSNDTSPSVRSVLDSIRGNADMATFWRTGAVYLSLTDSHSNNYNVVGDDNITIIEFNKRDYLWIMDQKNHRLLEEE